MGEGSLVEDTCNMPCPSVWNCAYDCSRSGRWSKLIRRQKLQIGKFSWVVLLLLAEALRAKNRYRKDIHRSLPNSACSTIQYIEFPGLKPSGIPIEESPQKNIAPYSRTFWIITSLFQIFPRYAHLWWAEIMPFLSLETHSSFILSPTDTFDYTTIFSNKKFLFFQI